MNFHSEPHLRSPSRRFTADKNVKMKNDSETDQGEELTTRSEISDKEIFIEQEEMDPDLQKHIYLRNKKRHRPIFLCSVTLIQVIILICSLCTRF